jgi:hypothetical protein
MSEASDLVTVYRSMDANAKEDCEIIIDVLAAQGISAVMLDDSAPGVPEGTFEVQVPAADAARAEETIAENPLPDEVEEVDNSADLDLETIFHADGALAEVEALGIKNVLEANGVAAVLVGNSVLPTLPFEVRVARDQAERARQLIAEAEAGGPAAAEEAERKSESGSNDGNPKR